MLLRRLRGVSRSLLEFAGGSGTLSPRGAEQGSTLVLIPAGGLGGPRSGQHGRRRALVSSPTWIASGRHSSVSCTSRSIDATTTASRPALRPLVVNRKISGGHRTWRGAWTQHVLATVIGTNVQ